jgi:hypothetical protein
MALAVTGMIAAAADRDLDEYLRWDIDFHTVLLLFTSCSLSSQFNGQRFDSRPQLANPGDHFVPSRP